MPFFISIEKTVEAVIIAVAFAVLSCLCANKVLGALQALGYDNKSLIKWTKNKSNLTVERHFILAMCCVLATSVLSLFFAFLLDWAPIIGLLAYLIFYLLYIVTDKKIAVRLKPVYTNRFKRLNVAFTLLFAIISYVLISLLNFADYVWGNTIFYLLKYAVLSVLPMLITPVACLANLVCKIYEVPNNERLINKASKKLKNSSVKVIGITGSYGKTGVKNALYAMLSKKYKTLVTPKSFNTPLGVALTVNGNNLDEYDYFIVEMGARKVGDIAELCKICPPDYAVITGVCEQHIQTFGSFENVVKGKGEILLNVKNWAVIANDAFELFADYCCEKYLVDCVNEVDSSCNGTQFTLTLNGDKKEVKSKLLGEHSAANLGLAAKTAAKLGVEFSDIVKAIEEIDFTEHRLQLIKAGKINILDDGYNGNVKGAAAAIKVLKTFSGRKIVVTPGLVELGVLEEKENNQLGASLVGLDCVILVGANLVTSVKNGYINAGGNEGNLVIKPTLSAAEEYLKSYLNDGDTVLFLNDVPDTY